MATTEEARQWRGTTSLLEASKLRVQASEADSQGDERKARFLSAKADEAWSSGERYFERNPGLDRAAAQLSVAEDFTDWLAAWEGC